MGRSPCCAKEGLNRGAWTVIEDKILTSYIAANGDGKWRNLPKRAGLKRCGKSCRLRWLNYLRPDIKRGNISPDEEELIVRLHKLLGNRWSLIAGRLPGRTDNEIKNYWNTTIVKRLAKPTSPSPPFRAKRKTVSSPPSNHRWRSPPPWAKRPLVTRAKPNKSLELPPSQFIPNDNQSQSPIPPLSIPHIKGTSLPQTSGDSPREEVRDGYVGDLGFLDFRCESFRDNSPDCFITMDDKMLEEWATTYDSAAAAAMEEVKDTLDLESLAFLLEEWPSTTTPLQKEELLLKTNDQY